MEPLNIALIGCGTVGGGVAKLLLEQPERLAACAGRPLVLRCVVVRDPDKPRAVRLPRDLVTTDLQQVLRDPAIHVAVEVVGGVDWARQADLALLAAGKDVVTANKRCWPSTAPRSSTPPGGTAGPSPSRPAWPAACRSSPPWPRASPPIRY